MKSLVPLALAFWLVACSSESQPDDQSEEGSAEMEEMVGTLTKTQYEEIKKLAGIRYLMRVWSQGNEDRVYPESLADEEFREEVGSPHFFEFEHRESGEVKSPIYVRGHAGEGTELHILLASPWVHGDKRVVSYNDGTSECIDESLYQEQLSATLKLPGVSLDE